MGILCPEGDARGKIMWSLKSKWFIGSSHEQQILCGNLTICPVGWARDKLMECPKGMGRLFGVGQRNMFSSEIRNYFDT